MKHTLSRADRLKSYTRIRQLFEKGSKLRIQPLLIYYHLSRVSDFADGSFLQMGVSVGSRHFKRAVDRNLLKRRVREAYRLQKHVLADQLRESGVHMDIFFVYLNTEIADYPSLYAAIEFGIKQLENRIRQYGESLR
jgi:ribonuclease P protein component